MSEKQELALVGGATNVWQISEAVSDRLLKLCAGASNAEMAVADITSAGLLAEARDALPAVRRVMAPLDGPAVLRLLEPLILIYGTPSFGAGAEGQELKTRWWDVYLKQLGKVPREALDQAVDDYIGGKLVPDPKTGRVPRPKHVFPSPAELLLLASARSTELRLIAWRIQKAAEHKASLDARQSPANKAAMGAALRELLSDIGPGRSMADLARERRGVGAA